MNRILIIRYSEIHLKGNNRRFFENLLIENIKNALLNETYRFVKTNGRYLVENYPEERESAIKSKIKKVFGVCSVSAGEITESDLDSMTETAKRFAPDFGTFKIETNRADKTFPMNSVEISKEIGHRILEERPQLKVDLKHPEKTVFLDLRENGKTLLYSEVEPACGGMPVGSGGNATALLSGGIDSPVAAYMMAKRGMRLKFLHFNSYPYTGLQAKEKVIELAKKLKEYCLATELYVVSLTEIQTEIHRCCPEELQITLMRRFMMKIAENISVQTGGGAIITGESLGQVASQTLESITSSNAVVHLPVFRPLIGFDKQEIIERAVRIGTYDISVLPYEDCCTVFLPKKPAIHPSLKFVEKWEKKLEKEKLLENALNSLEMIEI